MYFDAAGKIRGNITKKDLEVQYDIHLNALIRLKKIYVDVHDEIPKKEMTLECRNLHLSGIDSCVDMIRDRLYAILEAMRNLSRSK